MPRPRVILQSEFPYHVSARCINKEWFNLPMDLVWKIMTTELTFITYAYGVKIHSFVLMNNHFHLLVTTPHSNLDKAMWSFMGQTSRFLTEAGNRTNQTYGNRYSRSIIKGYHYFAHAYKYVYANPKKAGLVDRVENYPFSSLKGLLGFDKLPIPIIEDTLLFQDVAGTLEWLNKKSTDENWNRVRQAMLKRDFKLAKDKNSKRHSILENAAL